MRSPWGPRQPEPFLVSPTQIFALSLKKDGRFPFAPPDELHPDEPKKDPPKKEETKTKAPPHGEAAHPSAKPVAIDLAGISERIYRVPVPAGRYTSALQTDGPRLYWLSSRGVARAEAQALRPRHRSRQAAAEDRDGRRARSTSSRPTTRKLLVRKETSDRESDLYVFDAGDKAPDKLDESRVDLGRWTFSFDPREQWRQMFVEAWRLERDYFYDRGMHGLDWPKVRDKYLPLVERVRSRDELNDLIGQMVGELSALHIFVVRGDMRRGTDEVEVASLGAELVKDAAGGGFRVARIYTSDPDVPGESSRRSAGTGPAIADGRRDRVGERRRLRSP